MVTASEKEFQNRIVTKSEWGHLFSLYCLSVLLALQGVIATFPRGETIRDAFLRHKTKSWIIVG